MALSAEPRYIDGMTGQVEIIARSPALRNRSVMEAALERAADDIYGRLPEGGPCVSGEPDGLSVIVWVDNLDAAYRYVDALRSAIAEPVSDVQIRQLDPQPA